MQYMYSDFVKKKPDVIEVNWFKFWIQARRTGSDGSMSTSGSAGPGFDPRRGSKLSFENFQPSELGGVESTLSNRKIVHHSHGLNSKPLRSTYVERTYSTVYSNLSIGWGR